MISDFKSQSGDGDNWQVANCPIFRWVGQTWRGLRFFKWANSGYTWSVLWWYLGWWLLAHWSLMSCQICRYLCWGHGADGQAGSWLANRPGTFWRCLILKWQEFEKMYLNNFIRGCSLVAGLHVCDPAVTSNMPCAFQRENQPPCCWAATSCETDVLCTRMFHTVIVSKLCCCTHLLHVLSIKQFWQYRSYVCTSSFCGCQNMKLCHTMQQLLLNIPGTWAFPSLRRCCEPWCLEVAKSTIVSHDLCALPIVRHLGLGLGDSLVCTKWSWATG